MRSKELFFYELEGRGYIFQNKKWDEAKHGFEDDMLNMAWEMWSSAKHSAKSQAVPEGFVLVKTFDIAKLAIAVSRVDLMTYSEARPDSEKLAWQDVANKLEAMIEAQEPAND